MKVHLMFKDDDFHCGVTGSSQLCIDGRSCFNSSVEENLDNLPLESAESVLRKTLISDLEMDNIINVMANSDDLIKSVSAFALSNPLKNIDDIKYRQDILKDVIKNKDIIAEIYNICRETGEEVRYSRYSLSSEWMFSIFSSAVGLISIYIKGFKKIRDLTSKIIKKFSSDGMTSLLNMICDNFSDSYISKVQHFLGNMNEVDGTLISAKFGSCLQGTSYVYRKGKDDKLNPKMRFAPSYTLPERDSVSAEDLCLRRDRAINNTANVLAKAAENFDNFFNSLKNELGFYVGCVNLYDKLNSLNMDVCFPELEEMSCKSRKCKELYDVSLALLKNEKVTGSDVNSDNKLLYIITGANQGGKTTFLRSVGQAQLMAQCGMFVCGQEVSIPLRNNIYSHFKKEEDNKMNSGKLDEEMSRMDKIISLIKEDDMILSNESFSSTNEREGSEIFFQITKALIEHNVEMFCVTHMLEYALAFEGDRQSGLAWQAEFLKAQRTEDGKLTFKIMPGKPSSTAFGEEIYKAVFNK